MTPSPAQVCQKLEFSVATLAQWRTQFCGMRDNQVKRPRALGEESRRLKKPPAALANPQETRGLLGLAAPRGSVQVWRMTPAGSEQPKDSRKKRGDSKKGGAKSGAPLATVPVALDPDLVRLAAAWDDLPPAARAGIAAMARAVEI